MLRPCLSSTILMGPQICRLLDDQVRQIRGLSFFLIFPSFVSLSILISIMVSFSFLSNSTSDL